MEIIDTFLLKFPDDIGSCHRLGVASASPQPMALKIAQALAQMGLMVGLLTRESDLAETLPLKRSSKASNLWVSQAPSTVSSHTSVSPCFDLLVLELLPGSVSVQPQILDHLIFAITQDKPSVEWASSHIKHLYLHHGLQHCYVLLEEGQVSFNHLVAMLAPLTDLHIELLGTIGQSIPHHTGSIFETHLLKGIARRLVSRLRPDVRDAGLRPAF